MEKNKNLTAITIGLILIILVVSVTFIKFNRKEKLIKQENIEEIEKIATETKEAKSIDAKTLLTKMGGEEKITLIDIRSSQEFQKEHLQKSTNIPFDTFEENLSQLDKNFNYIFIDATNSVEIINLVGIFLPKNGFKNVYYLEGGFNGWKNTFYPTVSAGYPNSLTDQAKISYIDSVKLKEFLDVEKNVFIIDVRGKNDYDTEHIPKAINIFVDDIEKKIKEIPLGKKIIIYDADTISAFQASVRLFDLGKMNVLTLSDGFGKWKEKGFPIEKTQL